MMVLTAEICLEIEKALESDFHTEKRRPASMYIFSEFRSVS